MGEVDEDLEILAQLHAFEPAADALKACQSRSDPLERNTKGEADARCAQRVVNVESRGHTQ